MAGVAITVMQGAAPQSGTRTIKCSSPTSVAGVDAAMDTNKLFVSVTTAPGGTGDTDPGGKTLYIGVAQIVTIADI